MRAMNSELVGLPRSLSIVLPNSRCNTDSRPRSHAVSTALPVHPASPLYDQTLAGVLSYAPEALVSQLEDLGVLGRELVLLVNRENTAKLSAAQLIAGQLESAGMEITVNALDFEDYTAALAQGGPEGLAVEEFSCGETVYDQQARLLKRPAQAVCAGDLCAAAGPDGVFTEFEVRGGMKQ